MANTMEIRTCCERMEASADLGNPNFQICDDGETVSLLDDSGKLLFGNIDHCPFCGCVLELIEE